MSKAVSTGVMRHGDKAGIEPASPATVSSPLTQADYEAQAAFRYALRQFLRFSEDVTRELGMTPQKYQALLAIKGYSGPECITITKLAERLQIQRHSAVGLVNRLAAQGLLERQPAVIDRRRVYVALTAAGTELLDRLVLAHRSELQQLWPELRQPLERLWDTEEARKRRYMGQGHG